MKAFLVALLLTVAMLSSRAEADNPTPGSLLCEPPVAGMACGTFVSCVGLLDQTLQASGGKQGAYLTAVNQELEGAWKAACADPQKTGKGSAQHLANDFFDQCESACRKHSGLLTKSAANPQSGVDECKATCRMLNGTHFAFLFGYQKALRTTKAGTTP